jgi:hypothetical protein
MWKKKKNKTGILGVQIVILSYFTNMGIRQAADNVIYAWSAEDSFPGPKK